MCLSNKLSKAWHQAAVVKIVATFFDMNFNVSMACASTKIKLSGTSEEGEWGVLNTATESDTWISSLSNYQLD